MQEERGEEIGYRDAACWNSFSAPAIMFGSYVRKCDMAAKCEKGPLETCLVVCTFGSYSLPENWILPSSRCCERCCFFICLCLTLGIIETEEAGCKIGPLVSKEQVKQGIERADVMQNNLESPVFLS